MKTLSRKVHVTRLEPVEYKITNVIHDLPTWMFPYSPIIDRPWEKKCPVCNHEMELQIGHGEYLKTCSMIQLENGDSYPIHRECYDGLEDK